MVIKIPNKLYNMEGKYAIIKANAGMYQKSRKKIKSIILDDLQQVLKMNRQYLSFLLRNTGRKVVLKNRGVVYVGEYSNKNLSKRGRKKVYTEEIEKVLFKIWVISRFISSKHLCVFIRLNSDILFSHKDLKDMLSDEIKEKLLKISAATIDRLFTKCESHRESPGSIYIFKTYLLFIF